MKIEITGNEIGRIHGDIVRIDAADTEKIKITIKENQIESVGGSLVRGNSWRSAEYTRDDVVSLVCEVAKYIDEIDEDEYQTFSHAANTLQAHASDSGMIKKALNSRP